MTNPTNDPYPWLTIDEEGNEFRVHAGRIDETAPNLSGWTFSPRSEEELEELGFMITEPVSFRTSDPYPWVTVDEDGEELRIHTAHEDGIDEYGNEWSGWIYAPRTTEELINAGY